MAGSEAAITTRAARADDAPFLEAMLVAALAWDPERPSVTVEAVRAVPEHHHYVDGWPRPDDLGVIAEHAGVPVGAAWLRCFGPDDPGYGFLAPDVPEVTIGVVAEHRGRGVGTRLLAELEDAARGRGIPTLSLSVEPANPARRLYERRGYVPAGATGGAVTLRLDL